MPGRDVLVIVSLCILAGGLGLFLGARPSLTETRVIEAGAAIYAEETGRSVTECVGVPGREPVWIEVRCGASEGVRTYLFDRGGALIVSEEVRI